MKAPMEPEASIPGLAKARRILVVDDSPIIRGLVRRTLELRGFEVVEAVDGADALSMLQQNSDYALIIVDLMMPRLDGFALIQQVRQDDSFPRFPILVLSAEEINPASVPLAGTEAYIAKPFLPSVLLQTIERLLNDGKD